LRRKAAGGELYELSPPGVAPLFFLQRYRAAESRRRPDLGFSLKRRDIEGVQRQFCRAENSEQLFLVSQVERTRSCRYNLILKIKQN